MSQIALCSDGRIKLCTDGRIKLGPCCMFVELNFSGISLAASGSPGYANLKLGECALDQSAYESSNPTVLTPTLAGSCYFKLCPPTTITAPIGYHARDGLTYVARCTQSPVYFQCVGQPSFAEQFCVQGSLSISVIGGLLGIRGDVALWAYGYGTATECLQAAYADALVSQGILGISEIGYDWIDLTMNLLQDSNVFSLGYGTMRVRKVDSIPSTLINPCDDWV